MLLVVESEVLKNVFALFLGRNVVKRRSNFIRRKTDPDHCSCLYYILQKMEENENRVINFLLIKHIESILQPISDIKCFFWFLKGEVLKNIFVPSLVRVVVMRMSSSIQCKTYPNWYSFHYQICWKKFENWNRVIWKPVLLFHGYIVTRNSCP